MVKWAQCRGWSAQRIRAAVVRPGHIRLDPRDVLSRLGVVVFEQTGASWSGAIATNEASEAFISLRAEDSEKRKTFTLAHELGHLLLHVEPGDAGVHFRDSNFTSGPDPRKEAQANKFARDLLMPKGLVIKLREIGFSTPIIAQHFGVSASALEVRLGEMFSRGEL